MNWGINWYIIKPINIKELDARVRNLITGRKYQQVMAESRTLDARIEELALSFAQTLEIRDFKTGSHSKDVLELGSIIAREMGIPESHLLKDSLLLHDIGKIGIPDEILLKESSLTDKEWDVMKTHSEIGFNLLKSFDSFKEVSDIILSHQENYDGTGYPQQLSGEDIPLLARVIAVADSYHAMTNDRPYRKALDISTALLELHVNRGKQFDPDVVEAFIRGMVKKELVTESGLSAAGIPVQQYVQT